MIQTKESQNSEKRYYCSDRFHVDSIAYNDSREVSALVIKNDKGQTVYELKAEATGSREERAQTGKEQKKEPRKESISKEQMASLRAELKRTGVAMETVQERYKIAVPECMNEKTYMRVMEALSKTKAA